MLSHCLSVVHMKAFKRKIISPPILPLFNYKMLVGATVSGRQENVQRVAEGEFANEHDFP